MISGLVWGIAVFLVVVMIGGTFIFLRRPDDRRLMRLSLLACFIALIFAPLVRALPEEVGLPFFLIGLWPTLAVIAVPVAASMVRVVQTRSRRAVISLALSVLAAGLLYLNSATPWLWPYRTP